MSEKEQTFFLRVRGCNQWIVDMYSSNHDSDIETHKT